LTEKPENPLMIPDVKRRRAAAASLIPGKRLILS